jgi:hypothetical protein
MDRSKYTGAWLTVSPPVHHGTETSKLEFIDSALLRVGKVPNGLPDTCDGCGATFTPEHAMQCKKGGLVTLRHNDLRDTYHHLAHKPSADIDEPLVHPCHDSARNVLPNTPDGGPLPKTCGDLGIHGFWKLGKMTIADIQVTDFNASYQCGHSAMKCLQAHEKSKKDKYRPACIANCRSFTPRCLLC